MIRVGLDLDGCCYSWCKATRILFEKRGYQFPAGGSRDWNSIKARVSAQDWRDAWLKPVEMYGNTSAWIPGARKAMRWLAANTDLVIITARPLQARPVTLKMLASAGVRPHELHVLGQRSPKTSVGGCDIYVEDNVEQVELLRDATGSPVLVPRRWWNTQLAGEAGTIIKYSTWREATRWIERMLEGL